MNEEKNRTKMTRRNEEIRKYEMMIRILTKLQKMYINEISCQRITGLNGVNDFMLNSDLDLFHLYGILYQETSNEHELAWDDRREEVRELFDEIPDVQIDASENGLFLEIINRETKRPAHLRFQRNPTDRLFLGLMDEMIVMVEEYISQ